MRKTPSDSLPKPSPENEAGHDSADVAADGFSDALAVQAGASGDTPTPWFDRPSKTRLKKESHDLQALGEAVVALPDSRLAGLAIDETLRDAIREFKRTRSHEGRRRQMQFIGKLMRRIDAEPLREAVAAMELGQAKDSLALHEAEAWRKRLVDSDDALTAWSADHPEADTQQLRSLIRAARKDAAMAPEQRSGRAFRELFKFIRDHRVAAAR